MILRCTKKLLDVIGARQLADRAPDGEDWYANLRWFDGRKCLLLTHGYQPPIELVTHRLRRETGCAPENDCYGLRDRRAPRKTR